jgi:predicted DNA-binding transcriptional regulator AlpA
MQSNPVQKAPATFKRPRLRTPEAAQYCGVSASFLNKLRVTGTGPRFSKISNIVLYDPAALDEWLDAHERTSTSGDAA